MAATNAGHPWSIGDNVHFLLRNRSIGDELHVDGLCSENGIWVEGKVVELLPDADAVVVKHFNWTSYDEEAKCVVSQSDLRFSRAMNSGHYSDQTILILDQD